MKKCVKFDIKKMISEKYALEKAQTEYISFHASHYGTKKQNFSLSLKLQYIFTLGIKFRCIVLSKNTINFYKKFTS